ncbi:MAG TPA: HAD hydrolase-like protein [Baekduia sp.]|nr:HAD hydrolase-like protein [Baekduia sp.]
MPADGSLRLDDVRGFVFDVDGTLVHRRPGGGAQPQPGAVEVLERIRGSGRPLVLFTNGSHVAAASIARGLRRDGLPVADDEVLTPIDSAISYLRRTHPGARVMAFVTDAIRRRLVAADIALTTAEDADVVLVAHVDAIDVEALERAARAIVRGARFLVGSYVPGYAGANGMIFSRGAMVAAAIAKVTSVRPKVVGKPSRPALAELDDHLGLPTKELAVIGDDLAMDIRLGRLGGSRTVLVRSGISASIDPARVPARHRPHAVVDGVADLIDHL